MPGKLNCDGYIWFRNVKVKVDNRHQKSADEHKGSGQGVSIGYRLVSLAIGSVCLVILAVAVYVKPDAKGYGSHTQLHLPACGFRERTGYPCPTCGMTTAFSLVVRGRILRAFEVQPAGTLLAIACVLIAGVAFYGGIWGRRVDPDKYFLFYITPEMLFVVVMLIILLSWGWLCLLTWLKHGS